MFLKYFSSCCYFFADSHIYICDFHREQAWERWLAKTSNGLVSLKQVILGKLRSVAKARTEADYNERVESLMSSEEWKANPKLRNWIGNTWLPQYKVGGISFFPPICHAMHEKTTPV